METPYRRQPRHLPPGATVSGVLALVLFPMLLPACIPADAYYGHAGALDVRVDAVAFTDVVIGETSTRTVRVHNAGTGVLGLTISATQPFAASRTTLTLDVDASADLAVTFTPDSYDDASGTLTITDAVASGGALDVSLGASVTADADADGHDATAAGGDDCDDGDRAVHPGATDDGGDQDCSGTASDRDGDGVVASAAGGADCDDDDATRSPNASEAANDIDDDCDGWVDEDFVTAGDIMITEIKPEAPVWIEICSTKGVHLNRMVLAGAELPGAWLDGCADVCASEFADCALHANVTLTGAIELSAETTLDTVPLDSDWPDAGRSVLSLDLSASDADQASAWCVTSGSPGLPNPACP